MLVNRLEGGGGTLFQTYTLCSVLRSVNTNVSDKMFVLGMVNCMSYVCQSQYKKMFGHFLLMKNKFLLFAQSLFACK